AILTAATAPALSRYTGVLFDEISSKTLSEEAWDYAGQHILIHSAIFGPIRATDLIPNYRYSPQLSLPDFSAKKHWSGKLTPLLAASAEFFLDLRAKNYLALAPLDQAKEQIFVEIVAEDEHGVTRALNHFNKQTKGIIVAELLATRPEFDGPDSVASWLQEIGFRFNTVSKRHWQVISR
ncbi:MAG: peroxide stress protein YaaA, partial [Microbacteriaceae bacterium]